MMFTAQRLPDSQHELETGWSAAGLAFFLVTNWCGWKWEDRQKAFLMLETAYEGCDVLDWMVAAACESPELEQAAMELSDILVKDPANIEEARAALREGMEMRKRAVDEDKS